MDHTVLPAITPCLPLPRKRSPDGASPDWGCAYLMQPTTHLSTPKGWKAESAWLADLQRTVYQHKWSPVSCRSSAGQGKIAGQRPTFYQLCHATNRVTLQQCALKALPIKATQYPLMISHSFTQEFYVQQFSHNTTTYLDGSYVVLKPGILTTLNGRSAV